MARIQIKSALLRFFTEHEGVIVHLDAIARHFELEAAQVRNGINNLRNSRADLAGLNLRESIQIVGAGNSWVFRPVPAHATPPMEKTLRLFTEIGSIQDGSIVIQCENGTLFKAVEL